MSQQIPDVFKRLQERKKERRDLRTLYREALAASADYQVALEEFEAARTKKKKIEATVQADFKSEFDKLEGLKLNIAGDN